MTASASTVMTQPHRACDCHVHVFGDLARYPMVETRGYTPPPASVADLRRFHAGLGITRSVLIQPSVYGTDNSCMLDALAALGGTARGIAVVAPDIDDATLVAFDAAGIRGVRINLESRGDHDLSGTVEALRSLARRIMPLGWHIQIYAALPVIAEAAAAIGALPVPVVIDHYGMTRVADGLGQPGFSTLLGLVRTGNVYVKLSAPYRLGVPAPYAEVDAITQALIAAAPERMLWASDWPHTNRIDSRAGTDLHEYRLVDDSAVLMGLLRCCPNEATRRIILQDNPSRLYRFD